MMLSENDRLLQTKSLEVALTIALAAIATASGFALWNRQFKQPQSIDAATLATLTERIQDIDLRKANSLGWQIANTGELLSEGDEVFAHEGSRAKIVFTDDSKITMSPNSLIKITQKNNETQLELIKGTLSGRSEKGIVRVKIGKRHIVFNKAEFKAEKAAGKAPVVTVSTGAAKVAESNLVIEPESEVVLGKNTRAKHFGIVPVNPKNDATLGASKAIEFSWSPRQGTTRYLLTVARDADLRNVERKLVTSDTHASVLGLRKGLYYWRVTDAANAKELSRVTTFALVGVDSPKKLSTQVPVLSQDTTTTAVPVTLTWISDAERFQLQLSHTLEFKENIVDKTIARSNDVEILGSGDYFWRVRSYNASFVSDWSATNFIHVTAALPAKKKESSPTLESNERNNDTNQNALPTPSVSPPTELPAPLPPPDLDEQYNLQLPGQEGFLDFIESIFVTQAFASEPPKIRWKPVAGAEAYLVEVASDDSFAHAVLKTTARSPELDASSLKPGLYFFHIATIDSLGRTGAFSKAARIRISTQTTSKSKVQKPRSAKVRPPIPKIAVPKPAPVVAKAPPKTTAPLASPTPTATPIAETTPPPAQKNRIDPSPATEAQQPSRPRIHSSQRISAELFAGPSIETYRVDSARTSVEFSNTTSYWILLNAMLLWSEHFEFALHFDLTPIDNGVSLPVSKSGMIGNLRRELFSTLTFANRWFDKILTTRYGLGIGSFSKLFLQVNDDSSLKLFGLNSWDTLATLSAESIFWDRLGLSLTFDAFLPLTKVTPLKSLAQNHMRQTLALKYLFDYDIFVALSYIHDGNGFRFENISGNTGAVLTATHVFNLGAGFFY